MTELSSQLNTAAPDSADKYKLLKQKLQFSVKGYRSFSFYTFRVYSSIFFKVVLLMMTENFVRFAQKTFILHLYS